VTSKLAFVGRFLGGFAALIAIGWLTNAPAHYARLLEALGAVLSPLTNGWWLERRPTAQGVTLWFRHGTQELKLLLSLESLSLGLLPLIALIAATPGLGWRRALGAVAIGSALFFALDLIVVLLYPLLVSTPNALTDIVGTFLGLLTFVGAPIILWFVLTFDRLRSVWRLDGRFTAEAQRAQRRIRENQI
jgi:hypothetical protein